MKNQQQIPIVNLNENIKSPTLKNRKIYIRSVKGVVERLRRYIGIILFLAFVMLPWVTYQGQQAILLDFTQQRFHFFGLTLWPQDLTLLAWLFIISAFALFFVTVILGRVWCGFMCPQTVFTFMFVWIEEKVEGARNKRIRLDEQAMNMEKFSKKAIKHVLWLLIALITSLTFVGYFTPVNILVIDLFTLELAFWPSFFVLLFMFCTYGNAGWMREVMCTHMCPYARFQSAMFDKDTITVTYNEKRGEGRGPRSKKLSETEYNEIGLGDCIDCNLCVQVCPTGIDIRNGLQYEGINCGACVDACNNVMSNMAYKKDLIEFTSQTALSGGKSKLLRPKVLGYFFVFTIMVGAFTYDLLTRPSLDIDIIRDRNSLFNETFEGDILNAYTVVLKNKTQQMQRYEISIMGLDEAVLIGTTSVDVPASELVRQPVTISISPYALEQTISEFSFVITNDSKEKASEKTTFIYTKLPIN
jgi:cytochrome c oxidase accessory protein FixG